VVRVRGETGVDAVRKTVCQVVTVVVDSMQVVEALPLLPGGG
jgi:hypothetical protein